MNSNTGADAYANVSNWLVGTAKRHPEALLVMAAGCALMMRTGASSWSQPSFAAGYDRDRFGHRDEAPTTGGWREGASRAAEGAAEYASDIKDRVAEAASSYASSVSDYAGSVGRTISTQTSQLANQTQSTIETGFGYVLREQPLALVVLGVAAGAALAALLPPTDVENRTLAPARESIAGAADKLGGNLMEAAGEAGERLKQGVADRGFSPEGLKGLAHEVADKFASKVSGKTDSVTSTGLAGSAPRQRTEGDR
jgi:hypothetical protein